MRVKQGDANAYDLLARRYLARAVAIARRLLQDPDDAEDLVQDAFMRALSRIKSFDEERLALHRHRFSPYNEGRPAFPPDDMGGRRGREGRPRDALRDRLHAISISRPISSGASIRSWGSRRGTSAGCAPRCSRALIPCCRARSAVSTRC